jgi:hypothetical protein
MNTIKLKDILSISGKGGLFKFIAQARNGIVVESIEDQKRHIAPSTARVSSLEDIAIFTNDDELPLSDVFYLIHQKSDGNAAISHKSTPDELKSSFRELVPGYDEERVYVSDIKKVFQWYNQLHAHDLLEVVEKEETDSDGGQDATPQNDGEESSSTKSTDAPEGKEAENHKEKEEN